MGEIRELRPRGYYLAHEAGWLAGVSGDRIGQWARRGYTLGDVRRIARDLRRGGWAVRGLPDLRSIEVDPDRLSGRPAISGTRVPAELVAQLARTEAGQKTLRSDYGVTAQQMKDATVWWRAVEELAAAA